jgi:Uma2 family endonuclease
MVVTTGKWTIDDYRQMIAAELLDDRRVELLKGEIIEMPPEGEPHAYSSGEAGDYLRSRLGDKAKIREAHPITLPNHSEPEPDIAIAQPLGQDYLQHHSYPKNIFWLIEYSESSLDKDLETKRR